MNDADHWERLYRPSATCKRVLRHSYTIGTLDVLEACDACADVLVIVQCTDSVVFPVLILRSG